MGRFEIALQEHRRIRLPQLKHEHLSGNVPALVDTRSASEFAGYTYAYQPRRGRIPTAIHIPFTSFFSKTGNFIDQQTYLQGLPETLSRAGRLVAYCEVGVRSALFALLHEIYTGRVVANYDGSILEWALDPELPMERDSRSQYRPPGAIHYLLRRF